MTLFVMPMPFVQNVTRIQVFTNLTGHSPDHLNDLLRLLSPALVFLDILLHGPTVVVGYLYYKGFFF